TAGGADALIRRKVEKGQTLYLNLTPLAYAYFPYRAGKVGEAWREVIGRVLRDAALKPRVEILGANAVEPWMESLLWRNGDRYCLAILKNLSESGDPAESAVIEQEPKEIQIRMNLPARGVRNIRSDKVFGDVASFKDRFNPWEANLYEFTLAQ